jgi:hypothetical protein
LCNQQTTNAVLKKNKDEKTIVTNDDSNLLWNFREDEVAESKNIRKIS